MKITILDEEDLFKSENEIIEENSASESDEEVQAKNKILSIIDEILTAFLIFAQEMNDYSKKARFNEVICQLMQIDGN
jgi:hypothetical protein